MRRCEAYPANAVDCRNVINQSTQICNLAVVHGPAICVDVLTEQVDLSHALSRETGALGNHVIEGPVDLFTAGIRHYAKTAVLAATFHDRNECRWAFRTRFGQAVELFDLGKRDINDGCVSLASLFDEFGQTMQRLRPEHDVDERGSLRDAVTFLTRHATADTNHDARPFLLQGTPAAKLGKHLFLGLFANGAGVDEQQVGVIDVIRAFITVRLAQNIGHLVRVVLVHLATHRFDVKLTRHTLCTLVARWAGLLQLAPVGARPSGRFLFGEAHRLQFDEYTMRREVRRDLDRIDDHLGILRYLVRI